MPGRDANDAASPTSLTVSGDDGASSLRPQRLLVSVFGAFLREVDGWVSYDALIRLMAELDVDAKATRASANRLLRRGLIEADAVDRTAGLRLTPRAMDILTSADRRIFRPVKFEGDDRWVLVVFSIPESRRSERHLMRSRLEWLGFGRVTSGVWIAPGRVEPEVVDMLERMRLADYATVLRADTPGVPDLHGAVRSWWDLETIAAGYEHFIAEHATLARSLRRRTKTPDDQAFAEYTRMLTLWRRLPFFDPGLPTSLLAPDWIGYEAVALFHTLHDGLSEPARRHVHDVTGTWDVRPKRRT